MCGKTWKNLQVHKEAHFILDSVQVGKGHLAIVKKKKKKKHGLSAEGMMGGKLLIIRFKSKTQAYSERKID